MEQIASKLPISHETVYLRVYADKAEGGVIVPRVFDLTGQDQDSVRHYPDLVRVLKRVLFRLIGMYLLYSMKLISAKSSVPPFGEYH